MQLEKYYNLLYRKEMVYTLQPIFCKVDYRNASVQCLNSTQDSTILMMVLEAVMDVASGITEHKFISDCRYIYRVTESSSLV